MTDRIDTLSDNLFAAGNLAHDVISRLIKILGVTEMRRRIKTGWEGAATNIIEAQEKLDGIGIRLWKALPMAETTNVSAMIQKAMEYSNSAIDKMKGTRWSFQQEYNNISHKPDELVLNLRETIKSAVATYYAITAAFVTSGKFIPPGYPKEPFPEKLDYTGSEYTEDIVGQLTIVPAKEVVLSPEEVRASGLIPNEIRVSLTPLLVGMAIYAMS